ncbi:MAG: TonB-dependent receptor plug domain-containing protein, partial [Sphingopyxis sp.]|nr:TonB-dependent receptor plug domain-containing protein [Sphingopyxis sp.]
MGVGFLALSSSFAISAPLAAQSVQGDPETAPTVSSEGDSSESDIVVTASRIDTAGFDAPTPTTVIGEAELRQAGRTDIQATLADLPQIRLTSSATSTNTVTNSGQSPGDLRGLGAARTLVLVNGRRSVSSGDLQTVPYSLVKQIDVVTGGASAAWGSGAVAGVINIILDDNLQGLSLGAQMGVSGRGDAQKRLFNAAFGTRITDRWHFMIGADYLDDEGVTPAIARPRIGATAFFPGLDGRLFPTQDIR